MPRRRDASVGTLCILLLAGCVRLDQSHCANREGDATCAERGDALAVCSECVADNDGCVAGPVEPDCIAAASTGGSSSASVADDGATQDPTDDPSASTSPPSTGEGSAGEDTTTASTNALDDTSTSEDTGTAPTSTASESSESGEAAFCGNGEREADEFCDGEDLDGQTCLALPGFAGGTLTCDEFCFYNTSQCTACLDLIGGCVTDEECCNDQHCNLGLCVL
jgi:hypothetical protein